MGMSLLVGFVKVHLHDLIHVYSVVKLLKLIDHGLHRVLVDVRQRLKRQKVSQIGESQKLRAFLSEVGSVSVSHTLWESKLLKDIAGGLSLHGDSV